MCITVFTIIFFLNKTYMSVETQCVFLSAGYNVSNYVTPIDHVFSRTGNIL